MGSVERVKYGNIKIPQEPHIVKYEMPDGSFQAYVYDRPRTEVDVKFTEENYYNRLSYRAVPNVVERKLLCTISVIRKSVHNFKVVILTPTSSRLESAKNYDEVNEILVPLFKKKQKKS